MAGPRQCQTDRASLVVGDGRGARPCPVLPPRGHGPSCTVRNYLESTQPRPLHLGQGALSLSDFLLFGLFPGNSVGGETMEGGTGEVTTSVFPRNGGPFDEEASRSIHPVPQHLGHFSFIFTFGCQTPTLLRTAGAGRNAGAVEALDGVAVPTEGGDGLNLIFMLCISFAMGGAASVPWVRPGGDIMKLPPGRACQPSATPLR